VLARFYRYTYRPNLAISVFTDYQQSEPVRRKVLSEAYVVGEAAWQLWWRNGSSALPQVEIARNLLSESVEAGYLNARTVISLAMLETASNYAEANDVEALRRMFSFGFDNGASWNSLGTFVREFLNDDALALRLYNVGLKLSPKNHYLWLNKARILARLGQAGEAAYARRTARQFAPHVFLPFIDEVSEQDASESL
jgi:tetratricopeptide (TPR) repeat protein